MTGGTLRDHCPACGSANLAEAFTRAEWRDADAPRAAGCLGDDGG